MPGVAGPNTGLHCARHVGQIVYIRCPKAYPEGGMISMVEEGIRTAREEGEVLTGETETETVTEKTLENEFRVKVASHAYKLHHPVYVWSDLESVMKDERKGVISQKAGPFARESSRTKDYKLYIHG